MTPGYSGFYINLDASTLRRARLEEQLAAVDLESRYSRFAAADGTALQHPSSTIAAGELGCFVSHARLLRACANLGTHVHILEDDVILSPELGPAIDELIAGGAFAHVDLLYTDVFVPIDCDELAEYEQLLHAASQVDQSANGESSRSMRFVDLRGRVWAATSSYIVADRCVARLASLLESELMAGPRGPIDLIMRELVNSGALRAACIVPFLTSVDLVCDFDSTTREGISAKIRSRVASNIVRQMFFVRPDWETITKIMHQYFPPEPKFLRREVINRMLDFRVFGDFQRF